MILVRQVQKILANVLVWLLVLTNLILPAAQAANTAEKTAVTQEQAASQDGIIVLQVDKSQAPQTALVTTTVDDAGKNKKTDQDKVFQFGNQLLSYYLEEGKSAGPEWLRTTTLNFYISKDFKPTYSLETIQPFGERNNNPGGHWFWQGRYARSEDASTFNFGVGWRNLAPDRQSLLGMNLFYDYGFKYNLARIGLGGEYFNKLSEYRFNVYHPVTGDKLANVNYQESGILYSYIRAVDGIDFELGTSFSHAPWLKAFLKGYYYDNKHKDDERGYQLRTTMQVSPRFSLELGYRYSNLQRDPYAIVRYQLADTMPSSLKGKAKKDGPYDLSDKILQLVERENDIKTETWTKFIAYRGSIKTTVTNRYSNTAIVGATVEAYQNGAAVGTAVVTDTSGIAMISGLAVGTYTIRVKYGSYSKTSDVTVVKDTTVPADVSLDVVGGGAKVTVLDTHSVGISGATVVARESSSPTVALSVSMTTNASGFAAFTNLPPGAYTFTATYQGNSMASEVVSITAGNINDVTILLPVSGGNIRAVVTNDSGIALSGATVAVLSGTTTVATGTTGTNGVALLSGIAAGSYTVSASLADYTAGSTASVEISDGKTSTGSLILTRQTGSVAVSVITNDGAAVMPRFYVDGSATPYSSITYVAGVYILTGLTTNVAHTITVQADNYTSSTDTTALSVTPHATAIVNAGSVTLTRQTGSVTVSVITNDGAAVTTRFYVDGSATPYGSVTSAAGVYMLAGLTTNVVHTIKVSADNYTSSTDAIALSVTPNAAATVNAGSVTLTLHKGTLTVTLKDNVGNLLVNTAYSLSVSGATYAGTTDTNGQAAVNNIATSATSVIASVTGYNDTSGTITWTGTTGIATITLAGNGSTSSIFTVVDQNGGYLGGATVSLTGSGTTITETTAADGKVTINGMTSGIAYSYTVTMMGTSSESGTISAGQSKTARLTANSGHYFFLTISDNSANATYIQITYSGYSVRVPLTPNMNMRYTTNIMPTAIYQITSNVGTCDPSTRQIGSGNPVTISIN